MRHEGYTVVRCTDFVSYRISLGQVTIVAELNDEATDMEWLKYLASSDNDLDLARESFLSTFGKQSKPAPTPPPAKTPATAEPVVNAEKA